MSRTGPITTVVLAALVMVFAASMTSSRAADVGEAVGRRIIEGPPTLEPVAFTSFCIRNERDCATIGNAGRVTLTPALARQLVAVNAAVNGGLRVDRQHAGHIAWSVDAASGDCNTFALEKKHRLLVLHWPASALSLAVVRLPEGPAHLVLLLRTGAGDLVLDNLRGDIVDWGASHYSWIKVQSVTTPRQWVEVVT